MQNFNSKHFTLQEVTDGVFAAIAKDGGGAVGNAGFIDLGDKTIVFDTFNTPQAAEDLKNMAEQLTGRSVTWVVNSHWHGDHIRGNQVFENSMIVSSQTSFQFMKENHPARIQKQKDSISDLEAYIHSLETQDEKDEKTENQLSFLNEIKLSLPILKLKLPQYTFKNEFTIHGSRRTANILTLGGAHSPCDSILYIPDEEIIFMGDILFVNTHPTLLPESNPSGWLEILRNLKDMKIKHAVPGHGPVGNMEDIAKLEDYIQMLLDNNDDEIPIAYSYWASPEIFYENRKIIKEFCTKA